jgi:hypothetical protein
MSSNNNIRRRGGNANQSANQQAVGQVFPPALPASIRKLINGRDIVSIAIVYTSFGVQTVATGQDGETHPLDEIIALRKEASASRIMREEIARLATRIDERGIEAPKPSDAVCDRETLEVYLESLEPDVRRVITMSNRDFRAQTGKNDEAPSTGAQPSSAGKAGKSST